MKTISEIMAWVDTWDWLDTVVLIVFAGFLLRGIWMLHRIFTLLRKSV